MDGLWKRHTYKDEGHSKNKVYEKFYLLREHRVVFAEDPWDFHLTGITLRSSIGRNHTPTATHREKYYNKSGSDASLQKLFNPLSVTSYSEIN